MKRIKILSILLVLVLMFTVQIPICAVDASATLTVVESEISAEDGRLNIRLNADEQVLGGSFNLVYDSSVLQFTGANSSMYSCQINESYAANRIRVSFAGSRGTTSGIILTFHFTPIVTDSCTAQFFIEEINLHNVAGASIDALAVGAVCDVTVIKAITDVQLSASSITMGAGEKANISYNITPDDASVKSVSWTSVNQNIASVDNKGVVTAKRSGQTSIRCVVTDRLNRRISREIILNVYEKPNITVAGGYLTKGESVVVAVRLDTIDRVYTSGSLNITYDTTVLSLDSAVAGSKLSGCMTTVNPNYRENTVRLNFLSQNGIRGSGEICLLTFTALKNGEGKISVEDVLLYTEAGEEHGANIGGGTVTVGDYTLALSQPTNGVAWHEFETQVAFSAAPKIAGGSFIISYDPEQIRFLGCKDTHAGYTVTVNDTFADGQIKISFAGTQGLEEGMLLALRFVSLDNPQEGIATKIGFADVAVTLYTQNGVKIQPTLTEAELTLTYSERPTEKGDADYNGEIDTRDATALLKYISGASDAILVDSFADVNGDGVVTDADMVYLMKILAGWDPAQIS